VVIAGMYLIRTALPGQARIFEGTKYGRREVFSAAIKAKHDQQ